jgi:hypothetical protein
MCFHKSLYSLYPRTLPCFCRFHRCSTDCINLKVNCDRSAAQTSGVKCWLIEQIGWAHKRDSTGIHYQTCLFLNSHMSESLSSLLGNSREPSLREQIEEMTASGEGCCSLSYEERIIGFAGCVISGLFLNMFSMIRLTELMLGNPKPFAVCFTLGNLLSMGSMLFLVGPA